MFFGFKHLAAPELIWLLCNLDLAFSFRSPTTMAEANVDAAAQSRRGVVRNRLDDQGRNARQRVDDLETRMDAVEAQGRSHETRLLFLEAHVKVVLRGFTTVQEFLRDLPGDFKLAKSAHIAALVAEFKDNAFPEAAHCIDEAEMLLCENQGVVVVRVFPTGGHLGTAPDGITRLQPTWAGWPHCLFVVYCGAIPSRNPSVLY